MTEIRFHHPSREVIEQTAHEALRRFPEQFRQHMTDIVMRVEEFADAETLEAMNIPDPWQLVGLYRGHPLDKQSIWASGDMPPTIFLYRQPLLMRRQTTGASLDEVVNHLVVHEVGHHFGLSDAQMHALESGA